MSFLQPETSALEREKTHPHVPPQTPGSGSVRTSPSLLTDSSSRRFAIPKTDDEIQRARELAVPAKTVADTKYCNGIFEEWRKYRMKTNIPAIADMTKKQMQYRLTRFVLEVRKKNGDVYPPNSLHHIVVGIMRHVRWSGQPNIDFFTDHDFANLRGSLDAEMKRLQKEGVGVVTRQAEILSEAEEETLWEKGLLGDHTPQTLLDTMVFYTGYYFALRSGREHRQLRANPCQIEVIEHPGERSFLRYTEDISKNHPGGLKGRKIKPKVVIQHANIDNAQRCFLRLFKLYRSLCPTGAPDHAFYLRPADHPTTNCWYSKIPLGHTKLSKTVVRLCASAGIKGHKTNHSLRATTTSRLYHSGVDEQLVMERTGHRSLEGVRSYKRTSDAQREALSDILNRPKQPKTDSRSTLSGEHSLPSVASTSFSVSDTHTNQTLRALSLPSASFSNCNISFNIGSTAVTDRAPKHKSRKRAFIASDSEDD